MEMFSDLMEFVFIFAILGGMAFLVAQMSKERNVGFWTLFAISVFLTPFVGILVALVSGRKKSAVPSQDTSHKQAQSNFWDNFMKDRKNDKTPPPPPPPPSPASPPPSPYNGQIPREDRGNRDKHRKHKKSNKPFKG